MSSISKSYNTIPKSFLALLLLLWARYPIWEYISGAMSYMPGFGNIGETSIAIIIGILFIFSLKEIFKIIKIYDVLFYITIVSIYFISYFRHPENQFFLDKNYTVPFLLTVLPYYFVGVLINMDKCKKYFTTVSCLSILFQFIYIFLLNKGGVRGNESDNMIGYAYNILPHVTLVAYWMIEERSFPSVSFFVLGFLLLISMANRGSIVCLMTFMLVYLIVSWGNKRATITKIVFAVIGVLVVILFNPLVLFMYSIMESLNLNTRVLDFALSKSFTESEGRETITDSILTSFHSNIYAMHGIGGENQLGINYAHNILIEWWYAFGILLGSLFMVSLLYLIGKAFIKTKGVSKAFLLILIICGFESLFISNTYLLSPWFFMLIGYSVNCIRNSHNYLSEGPGITRC